MPTRERSASAEADHVLDGVDQVVVHPAAPLAVARVQERLAVAGRPAVVHLHAQVAAVGEPLRGRVVAPRVARPRPAVHVEHGREALARRVRRERQVAVDLEPVAGRERERLHRREPVPGEVVVLREEEAPRPLAAVERVVGHRAVVGREPDRPRAVGVVARDQEGVAGAKRGDRVDVGGEGGVEHLVLEPRAQEAHDLDRAGDRVELGRGDVVGRVVGERLGRPSRARPARGRRRWPRPG